MFHGPGPGRPKGLKNKATRDVQALVDRVFLALGGEEEIVKQFLRSENEEIRMKMFMRLQEYRYGKPRESLDATVTINDNLAERVVAASRLVESRTEEYVQ
jgi:hypothetical protein